MEHVPILRMMVRRFPAVGRPTFQPLIVSRKIPIALFMVGVLVVSGCGEKERKKQTGPEAIPVRVMRVEGRDIRRSLDYAANIRAQDEVAVYPKVSGKIVEKVKEDGSSVNKGEVIAFVDRDEVGFKFEKAPVESPLAGVIGRVYVDRGTSVTPQTPVALVVNLENVRAKLDVPEKYLPAVSPNQLAEVSVDAWAGQTFTGKVSKISPVVDLETRTAPVEITIANPGQRLKGGMFARVKLVMEERKHVPVVAKEAVMGKEPDTYVYVISGNIARDRKVRLGIRDGGDIEVLDGLKEGDRVVIMGQQRLRDGSEVMVEAGGAAPGTAGGENRYGASVEKKETDNTKRESK